MSQDSTSTTDAGTPPAGDELPYCRFAKRNLDKLSFLYPLVNNAFGDALNIELRHEQLFFVNGDQIYRDIGYSEKGTRFSEADFGKPIHTLEDMKKNGYWFFGRRYDPDVMDEALSRQRDGYYYSFFSNQCQDWADRLKKKASQVENDWGESGRSYRTFDNKETLALFRKSVGVAPTEPASMTMGVFAILLGIAAGAAPIIAGGIYAKILGLFFVAAGLSHGVYAYHGRDWRAGLPIVLLGGIYVAAGVFMLINSELAMMAMSLMLAIVLAVQGATYVFVGLFSRPLKNWGGFLVAGSIFIACAAMMFAGWPDSGERFMGVVVAFALISGGLSTIYFSYRTRSDID